ncbi:heterokaryon incompatibility protein-domain-containing protein [Xylariaceae sp. FL0016]|nr:heterokaryon incompatibility protein-domain-containing protein [Xylariaceae sp. FL0016]
MRLINVKTLELEGFIVDDAPPYAILSHTWGDDEVTYQDWQDQSKAAEMAGYAKIKAAIEQTIVNELKYLWVDTNCIDKSSSAELSEAINSMFLWYQRAKVCFVYLADIEIASEDAVERRAGAYMFESLKASRWFYRGWTLQELLAPKYLEFFSKDWQSIACLNRSRKNPSDEAGHLLHLVDDISKITGIRKRYLWDNVSYKSASIADRMYWASSRLTFRTEDKAYCLLGIFNINMPLLYGEGRRAFQRLQEEIIKISTDQSIFAWEWLDPVKKRDNEDLSILAPWPSAFTNRNISRWPQDVQNDPLDSIYTLSNFGLSLRLPIWQTTSSGTSFAVLDCMDLRCVGNNAAYSRKEYLKELPRRPIPST